MLVESYYHDRRYPICPYTLPQIYDRVCKDNTTTTITWTGPYEKYTIHQIYEQVLVTTYRFILCESGRASIRHVKPLELSSLLLETSCSAYYATQSNSDWLFITQSRVLQKGQEGNFTHPHALC